MSLSNLLKLKDEVLALIRREGIGGGQRGVVTATGSSIMDGYGLLLSVDPNFTSAVLTPQGTAARWVSSGAGTDTDTLRSAEKSCALQSKPIYKSLYNLFLSADVRVFVGFSGNVAPSSDDNIQDSIGVQKRAGDTNWFFYTNAADGTATRVDSGILVNATPKLVEIDAISGTKVKVSLKDAAGLVLASTTFETDLPAATVALYSTISVAETAATVYNMDAYYQELKLRP